VAVPIKNKIGLVLKITKVLDRYINSKNEDAKKVYDAVHLASVSSRFRSNRRRKTGPQKRGVEANE
jgi:hypothetical protein